MSVIRGKDVILYFNYQGVDQVVACFQGAELTTHQNKAETSTVNSGKWRTFRPISLEWNGTLFGLCSLDMNIAIGQLREVQFSLQSILIKFISTDPNGLVEVFTGEALIDDITNGGSFSTGISDYNINISGRGELGTELAEIIEEGCSLLWYYYDGVGGEFNTGSIDVLIGNTVDGRVFRDGEAYRLSGSLHDGSATPIGKEASFDPVTGAVGFSTDLPPLELGEQIDIPYIVCEEAEVPPDCVPVTIENMILPNGIFGQPYNVTLTLAGDAPFSLAPGVIKPTWMTIAVIGSTVVLAGTPNQVAANISVRFTVTNCLGASSDLFTDTIDVPAPITGAIAYNCYDQDCTAAGWAELFFTFDAPTPVDLTFQFAYMYLDVDDSQLRHSGENIIPSIPAGSVPDVAYDTPSHPNGHLIPFELVIPAGTTAINFNFSDGDDTTKLIYMQGFLNVPGDHNAWVCHSCDSPIDTVWVAITTPGYAPNFTITNVDVGPISIVNVT